MFTGLIQEIGRVEKLVPLPSENGLQVELSARLFTGDIALGESIAVDGVCLTVVAHDKAKGRVSMDVGPETLARTSFGKLATGDGVNLERALELGARLGGHLVAGHVDGVGYIVEKTPRAEAVDIAVSVPGGLERYIIEKGSICIDGISLTVNEVSPVSAHQHGGIFRVSIIPHTQTMTTLTNKPVGAPVNLEVDLIGKYVERLVMPYVASANRAAQAGKVTGLTIEKLKGYGFVDE